MEIDLCILCITFSMLFYLVLVNAFQGAALSEMTAIYYMACFSFGFPPPPPSPAEALHSEAKVLLFLLPCASRKDVHWL